MGNECKLDQYSYIYKRKATYEILFITIIFINAEKVWKQNERWSDGQRVPY
jgi:hypothetical protein